MKRRWTLVAVALLLSTSILFSVVSERRALIVARQLHVVRDLPKSIPGWTVIDTPVAATPEMQKAVGEMLNYDEAIFRTYSRGDLSISVYAAYWSPGKFHPRLIAIHTPDVCWLRNGMVVSDANYSYPVSLNGSKLWPAQYRQFDFNGQSTYVIYWHLVGGRPSGYIDGPNAKSRDFIANVWNDMWNGIGEQYFVRISSNRPISSGDLTNDALYSVGDFFRPILSAHSK